MLNICDRQKVADDKITNDDSSVLKADKSTSTLIEERASILFGLSDKCIFINRKDY